MPIPEPNDLTPSTDLRPHRRRDLRNRLGELRALDQRPGATNYDRVIEALERRLARDADPTAGIGQRGLQAIRNDPTSPEARHLRDRRDAALGFTVKARRQKTRARKA